MRTCAQLARSDGGQIVYNSSRKIKVDVATSRGDNGREAARNTSRLPPDRREGYTRAGWQPAAQQQGSVAPRPRLQLQKRTKPIERDGGAVAPSSASSSIFGFAKPRGERLPSSPLNREIGGGGVGGSGNGGGNRSERRPRDRDQESRDRQAPPRINPKSRAGHNDRNGGNRPARSRVGDGDGAPREERREEKRGKNRSLPNEDISKVPSYAFIKKKGGREGAEGGGGQKKEEGKAVGNGFAALGLDDSDSD